MLIKYVSNFQMRQLRVKPEGFRYFNNSKTFYLDGLVLEALIDEQSILIPKGATVQLVFDIQTLGDIKLTEASKLIFTVESFAQQAYSRGRRVLRYIATQINEDDNWHLD